MNSMRNGIIPDGNTESHVDLLVAFYNLQVMVHPAPSPKSKPLTKQYRDRVYRFFERYVPEIFTATVMLLETDEEVAFTVKHVTDNIPVEEEAALVCIAEKLLGSTQDMYAKIRMTHCPGIYRYPLSNHHVEWIDSTDLELLLGDHSTTRNVIDNFLDRQIIGEGDLNVWLRKLAVHQLGRSCQRLPVNSSPVENSEVYYEEYYQLDQPDMVPTEVVYEAKQWHGLDELMVLQDAILVGIVEVLNHRIEVKRCVNTGCERIFRVPRKGGKAKVYCGRSCQVKAYQKRKNR